MQRGVKRAHIPIGENRGRHRDEREVDDWAEAPGRRPCTAESATSEMSLYSMSQYTSEMSLYNQVEGEAPNSTIEERTKDIHGVSAFLFLNLSLNQGSTKQVSLGSEPHRDHTTDARAAQHPVGDVVACTRQWWYNEVSASKN